MNIIESEALELLEFYKIKKFVTDFCHSNGAKIKASQISVLTHSAISQWSLLRGFLSRMAPLVCT
jgi:dsDNA-specific endonuclease/ATPase MutS2